LAKLPEKHWLKNVFAQAVYRTINVVHKYGDLAIDDEKVFEMIFQLKTLNTSGGDAIASRQSEIAAKHAVR
jgi:hypothetical protein